jgi:hypothetical protein
MLQNRYIGNRVHKYTAWAVKSMPCGKPAKRHKLKLNLCVCLLHYSICIM